MNNQERDLVAEILAGELAEDAPEFQEAVRADSTLQIELDEMRALSEMMDAEAAVERKALHTPIPVPVQAAAKPASSRRFFIGLASAAALVVVTFTLPYFQDPTSPEEMPGQGQMLDGGARQFQRLEPQGPDSSFEVFRVEVLIPASSSVKLEIWDDAEPDKAHPLHVYKSTIDEDSPFGFTWSPAPELVSTLPDSIRWSVRVVTSTGAVLEPTNRLRASR